MATAHVWQGSQRYAIMLVLYCTKCMHEAQQPHSSTSLPNQWLPARKVVPPVPVKDVNFALTKVRKCQSAFQLPKNLKHSPRPHQT